MLKLVDWFRILADLRRAGVSNAEAARRIGVFRQTVQHWQEGSEPRYTEGKKLLELHAQVVGAKVEVKDL